MEVGDVEEEPVYGAEAWAADTALPSEEPSLQNSPAKTSGPRKGKPLPKTKGPRDTKKPLSSPSSKRERSVLARPAKRERTDLEETVESKVEVFKLQPRKKLKPSQEELDELEKNVLGDGSSLLKKLHGQESDSGVDEEDGNDSEYSDTLGSPDRKPAWHDDDDDELVTVSDVVKMRRTHRIPLGLKPTSDYQKFLRKKFTDVYGEPSWAKLDKKRSEDVDPDLAILRSSGKMIESPNYLTKGLIQIKRLACLNSSTRAEGPIITTVRFHPTTNVALVAGLGCRASLIQVDGSGNNKLACVHFDRFPVRCARFAQNGNEFVVGSNLHSHFYVYDMLHGSSTKIPVHHNTGQSNMSKFEMSPDGKFIAVVGRFGQIHLLTAVSKEWVGTLSMNGEVRTLCFGVDSKTLYSYGDQGEVYIWDIASRRLLHKFRDEGSINGVSLAMSPCGSYLAAGSSSGVVNLYDANTALKKTDPPPLKAIMNLVTTASTVTFNHSSQVLAIASYAKANAVKLVHLPSFSVFMNFPNVGTELHCVQDAAFSPNSGYLSLTSNRHVANLFRLKHFGNY